MESAYSTLAGANSNRYALPLNECVVMSKDSMPDVNQKERAARAWPILTQLAADRATTSYKRIGQSLEIHHRAIRFVLAEIQDFCLFEKLPPITILVVGQDGTPGTGFIAWNVDDLERGFELVYSYPWSDLNNPFDFAADGSTIESIASGIFRHTVNPKDAYARVKVRGMAQLVFREALLLAYGGQCALSEVYSPALLEAAHIIPWSKAKADQRVNPRNGVLLSTLIHRFLDLGWLTINEDYSVTIDYSQTKRNSFERKLLDNLHGSRLRLPDDEKHWPDPAFIRQRNTLNRAVQATRLRLAPDL